MARKIYTREEWKKMKKEDLEKLQECLLLDDGSIAPSPKKLFVSGLDGPMDLKQQVEGIIGSYLFQKSMHNQGFETMKEAEDFDVDDEPPDPLDYSGLEVKETIPDPPPNWPEPITEEKNDLSAEREPNELDNEKIVINGEEYVKMAKTSKDIAETN